MASNEFDALWGQNRDQPVRPPEPDDLLPKTYEAAVAEVEAQMEDVRGDNPDVGEDDAAHDLYLGMADNLLRSDKSFHWAIAHELMRCQLGWFPEDISAWAMVGKGIRHA